MALLHILWDDSQIWGLLAARAARAMDLPCRLVRAGEVAGGIFERERPALLLVPGGSARHKAESLGPGGMDAVRRYVQSGGKYLGFCGGAGLALTPSGGVPALGICPWQRAPFGDRLQHFMSGHLHATLRPEGRGEALVPGSLGRSARLPVWWAGRFASDDHPEVAVLASYDRPDEDFWLADLPIAVLPPDTFAAWRDLYGLCFSPTFLAGQPCVVHGEHGRGGYILSYSHLETPDSPEANRWLAHLLRAAGLAPSCECLPPWRLREQQSSFDSPALHALSDSLDAILRTGLEHGLLFERADWLFGWRTGIPGASLNNLWAAVASIREREPGNAALAFWKEHAERLAAAAALFAKGCIQYLLAERLAQTLAKTLPDTLPPDMLKSQRNALFGPPMQPDGLYKELIEPLETLAFLQLAGDA